MKAELSKAKSQVKEYALVFGPSHPELISAQARVASLQAELTDIVERARDDLSAQRDRTRGELKSLDDLLEAERKHIHEMAGDGAEFERLRTDLQRVSGIHSAATTVLESVRLADTTLDDGRGSIHIEILDDYLVPDEAIWPKKGPLLAVSVLLGGLMSIAGIVLTGYGKEPTLANLESNLELPVSRFIPELASAGTGLASTSAPVTSAKTEHFSRVESLMGEPASSEREQGGQTNEKPLPWQKPTESGVSTVDGGNFITGSDEFRDRGDDTSSASFGNVIPR